MKINSYDVSNNYTLKERDQIREQERLQQRATNKVGPANDEVTLSETAKRLRNRIQEAQNAPETRPEKVSTLKQQLRDGSYQINVQNLAQKMLGADSEIWG